MLDVAVLNVSEGLEDSLVDGHVVLRRGDLEHLTLVQDGWHGAHHARSACTKQLQQLQTQLSISVGHIDVVVEKYTNCIRKWKQKYTNSIDKLEKKS